MSLKPIHLRSPTATTPSPNSKTAFNKVISHIPLAADAMRRCRANSAASLPRSVFLLDWDDTCCPTTYLEWYGIMADLDTRLEQHAPQVDIALRMLEQRVLTLLKSAIQLGTLLIITNAGDGWVELSSSRFLPAVGDFLNTHYKDIKIISARARYIETYRQFPWRWKALTFSDVLQTILSERKYKPHELHVVVLGDSPGDRYAAYDCSDTLSKMGMPVTLKIIKFLERPTMDQLCKELAVLLDHLNVMTRHGGSFEVSMSNEQPKETQHSNSLSATTNPPEGVNAHDLAYHPYSSPSTNNVTSSKVAESVAAAAVVATKAISVESSTSQLGTAAISACAAAV